jgi:hypothetical protein
VEDAVIGSILLGVTRQYASSASFSPADVSPGRSFTGLRIGCHDDRSVSRPPETNEDDKVHD